MTAMIASDGLNRSAKKEVLRRGWLGEAIRRIETVTPQINAGIQPMYDLARQQVRQGLPNGLFRGVPSLMKDLLVYCAGVPTRSSNRFFRDFVSDHDSDIVRRYCQVGGAWARPTRRNWGWLPYTEPVLFAPSWNP